MIKPPASRRGQRAPAVPPPLHRRLARAREARRRGGDSGDWSGVELGNFTTLGAVAIRDPRFGLAVIQLIERFGVELYGQVRLFTLDRDQAPSVDDIVVGTVGTRIKF